MKDSKKLEEVIAVDEERVLLSDAVQYVRVKKEKDMDGHVFVFLVISLILMILILLFYHQRRQLLLTIETDLDVTVETKTSNDFQNFILYMRKCIEEKQTVLAVYRKRFL